MERVARKSLKDFAEKNFNADINLGFDESDAKRRTLVSCMYYCNGYFKESKTPYSNVFEEIRSIVNELGTKGEAV